MSNDFFGSLTNVPAGLDAALRFEQSVLGVLHRNWCPGVSFKKVKAKHRKETNFPTVTYEWYREHILYDNIFVPKVLTFSEKHTKWKIDLHTLLTKEMSKSELFMDYEEQRDPDWRFEDDEIYAMAFPIIRSYGIAFMTSRVPDRITGIVADIDKRDHKGLFVVMNLNAYAKALADKITDYYGKEDIDVT